MITIELDNEVIFTLRPSGTEPKIKYYSEIRDASATTEYASDYFAHLAQLRSKLD